MWPALRVRFAERAKRFPRCVTPTPACARNRVGSGCERRHRGFRGVGYGRAEHMCSRGEPLETRGLLGMCRVTSWLHLWLESGRREIPAGWYRPKRDEAREARMAAMTSRQRCEAVNCRAGAQVANCRAGAAQLKKQKNKQRLSKAGLGSGKQDSRAGGERPPC